MDDEVLLFPSLPSTPTTPTASSAASPLRWTVAGSGSPAGGPCSPFGFTAGLGAGAKPAPGSPYAARPMSMRATLRRGRRRDGGRRPQLVPASAEKPARRKEQLASRGNSASPGARLDASSDARIAARAPLCAQVRLRLSCAGYKASLFELACVWSFATAERDLLRFLRRLRSDLVLDEHEASRA